MVVLDPNTPGSGGLEVLTGLRTAMPDARVVVLTLIDSDTYRHVAMASGADGFVSKSNMVTELIPALRLAAQMRNLDAVNCLLLAEECTALAN